MKNFIRYNSGRNFMNINMIKTVYMTQESLDLECLSDNGTINSVEYRSAKEGNKLEEITVMNIQTTVSGEPLRIIFNTRDYHFNLKLFQGEE